ncbi:MAG: T9SS type A sorting domain-containing protein [Flaviramulus sp.]|nr:T9SS type A sorting domain-containing protein [Flaviramulus sp.]NNC50898.1 T9SS type A sorting domain-containing protein [Flaviramulus sp.]
MKKINPLKSLTLLITLFCGVNLGYGQTSLAKEDVAIIGVDTDDEDFTFLLRTDITSGTLIYFSDNEVHSSGNGLNNNGEGVVLFTAAANYSCGTVIGFISNNTEFSSVSGSFALNNTGDEVLAFQGYDLTTYEWTTFLHANVYDTLTTYPAGFAATDIVDGVAHNREYTGITNSPSWADLNNLSNYFEANNFGGRTLSTTAFTCGPCTGTTTTWDLPGPAWDNGAPDLTMPAIINAAYNTSSDGNISACSLTVNPTFRLTVDDGTFVEIENDVTIDGELIVETEGNFVQNDDAGTFTVNAGGLARVNKSTAPKADWFYYTYWSSPVTNETIGSVFPDVDGDRRFWFNAANFVDTDGDDIDDNGDDWQYALSGDTMTPGVGYAVTESRFFFGGSGTADFEGPFNNGDIDVNIDLNVANTGFNWNFIGNPYPSAVDFIAFQAANSSVVDGVAYFWSQATPPSESNPGNEESNFSTNDYATYTVGTGGAAGGSPVVPNQYIPSGQGFFIPASTSGTATFTNAMRMADGTSNAQFFKSSNSKKHSNSNENRLWVNLTSDNGVFNQILVGYVDGATNGNDGLAYDAPRIISPDYAAVLYSSMNDNNKKYVIQGKDINSINEDELINLGFSTTIDVETIYSLSIAQIEGEFLSNNPIYIKDNLLNQLHDLTASDYTFTSEVGEFNDRFEIVFNSAALSTTDVALNSKSLRIIELEDDRVQFTASDNLSIKTVTIFDLLGRPLYNFKGNNASETYTLSNLHSSIYIAKVALSNGVVVTKKAIKK